MGMMIIAAMLAAAQAEPEIKIVDVPGRGYQAQVKSFDATEYDAIVARISALAKRRCGALSVRFGRFRFDNRVDSARNVTVIENYTQSLSCYDPATDPYQPVPADWKASAADTQGANSFVNRFLAHMDGANGAAAAEMMDPSTEATKEDMDRLIRDMKMHWTGKGKLLPRLETWLNNPENAAYPGAYAFFTVLMDDPGVAGTCGGITVHRVRTGEYRIAQYDLRSISQALVDRDNLTNDDLDAICGR
jgi:hypothetical protein